MCGRGSSSYRGPQSLRTTRAASARTTPSPREKTGKWGDHPRDPAPTTAREAARNQDSGRGDPGVLASRQVTRGPLSLHPLMPRRRGNDWQKSGNMGVLNEIYPLNNSYKTGTRAASGDGLAAGVRGYRALRRVGPGRVGHRGCRWGPGKAKEKLGVVSAPGRGQSKMSRGSSGTGEGGLCPRGDPQDGRHPTPEGSSFFGHDRSPLRYYNPVGSSHS